MLRKQGTHAVRCPHCDQTHEHEAVPGPYIAPCDEKLRFTMIAVVGRSFMPNYGYTVKEYEQEGGANVLGGPGNEDHGA